MISQQKTELIVTESWIFRSRQYKSVQSSLKFHPWWVTLCISFQSLFISSTEVRSRLEGLFAPLAFFVWWEYSDPSSWSNMITRYHQEQDYTSDPSSWYVGYEIPPRTRWYCRSIQLIHWLQDTTKNKMILQIRPADTLVTRYHQEQDGTSDPSSWYADYKIPPRTRWYFRSVQLIHHDYKIPPRTRWYFRSI